MNRYERAAVDAMRWVAGQAVPARVGAQWAENGELSDELYVGTAGVLLAAAEVTAAGLDPCGVAEPALQRLLAVAATDGAGLDGGLFIGAAGWLVAVRAWATVAGDAAARVAAPAIASQLATAATVPAPVDRYLDVISGDAGILLALLGESGPHVDAALGVLAERLVACADTSPEGPWWRIVPGDHRHMPGVSHGTAGVGLALALAGDRLGRADLVELAAAAGRTLIALAASPEGWSLPNRLPVISDTGPGYSFGWCHGPTGTMRLFLALQRISPSPEWDRAIDDCLDALRRSGLPARRWPGFWDNHGRCCGTAGVGQLLMDRYAATGDTAWLDWATALADDVLSYAIVDADGTRWSNTEWKADPPDLPPTPGFMQGAAGIAGWLAQVGAAHAGRSVTAVRPVGAGTLV